jgi:hypothetical protein
MQNEKKFAGQENVEGLKKFVIFYLTFSCLVFFVVLISSQSILD